MIYNMNVFSQLGDQIGALVHNKQRALGHESPQKGLTSPSTYGIIGA